MVLAISKSKLSDTSTPSKAKRRLRKLCTKDILEEVEEDDTNDDSLKENQKKVPAKATTKDSDYEFDLKDVVDEDVEPSSESDSFFDKDEFIPPRRKRTQKAQRKK